jgi:hypothetical protein
MNEQDFYLMMNPVMLTKEEVEELRALLEQVKKENA